VHLALWQGPLGREATLARVQAAPPSWSFLNVDSSRLGRQALDALAAVKREGRGVVVFMHLDGRSPEHVQRAFGHDFLRPQVDGGMAVGVPSRSADALRDLGTGCQILLDLGLCELRLMTNSARPIVGVEAYGLHIADRVPLMGVRPSGPQGDDEWRA
jgi:3,4-dihydroxy 2-butanone 4-phosphate synthase/GTP cyclohydrolase II